MRKLYVIFFTALLLMISFFVGQYIYKISRIDDTLLAKLKEDNAAIQEEFATRYLPTATTDEIKLSPNARLVFKTKYIQCGHVMNEYKNVSEDEVNMTKDELQKKYGDWNITEFDEKETVLERDVDESCKEHFIIREKDGNLAVYIIDDDEVETLHEETSISTKYLTELDLLKLEDGIRVNGLEELNSKLEDFE